MQKYWLQTLDEYQYGGNKPYSGGFYFLPKWLFKYFNELKLDESSESAYFMWNSEQQRLTHKYDILCSLMPLVKNNFISIEEYDHLAMF